MIERSDPAASKRRIIQFGALILGMAAAFTLIGLALRPAIRSAAGPLEVVVANESADKLRADIYIARDQTTLELNAGETGRVRYAPKSQSELRMQVYRKNTLQTAIGLGTFDPGAAATVTVRLKDGGEVTVER